jgi:16S rRNA (adenine1518-N6/adenine1519-N6)-dimethyltransferase
VANLPYSITGFFLREFLEKEPKPKEMILMLQKEIAEKIIKNPPDSFLGLMVNYFSQVYLIKKISRNNFWPRPQVDSALVKIIPRKKEWLSGSERGILFKIAKIAFGQKRKMLLNSLTFKLNISKEKLRKIIRKANLSSQIRPQELTLKDWLKLIRCLKSSLK